MSEASPSPSIHATCVLLGARGVLIRGPSGAGKSRLALRLLQAAERGRIRFARLVADDRTLVTATNGRLLARPVPALAGLIEIRGSGIRQLAHEPMAVIALVVDLATAGERMPADGSVELAGIRLDRLVVPPETDPLPLVLAAIRHAA